jgi:hypothetical protein
MQAVVQLRRHFALATGKVGTPDRPDEQGVSGEDEPGFVAATQVADHQADAVWRVARRVNDIDQNVAGLQSLTVAKRHELEADAAAVALVQAVWSAGSSRQLRSARVVVRVDMRINDVRDASTGFLGFGDEPVFVTCDDIDSDCLLKTGASEEVRKRGVRSGALPEEHGRLLRQKTRALSAQSVDWVSFSRPLR